MIKNVDKIYHKFRLVEIGSELIYEPAGTNLT